MSAIAACRVELEALLDRLPGIIQELKRAQRIIDWADALTGTVCGEAPTDVDAPRPRPSLQAKTIAAPAAPPASRYPNDAKVRQALTGEWQTVEAVANRAKLPKGTAYTRLNRLQSHNQVETRTEGRRTLYRLAGTPAQLRPRVVAGTQVAPPVGPPSANVRQAPGAEFEVAWNGTKERNGEAPSILPPRERRA